MKVHTIEKYHDFYYIYRLYAKVIKLFEPFSVLFSFDDNTRLKLAYFPFSYWNGL